MKALLGHRTGWIVGGAALCFAYSCIALFATSKEGTSSRSSSEVCLQLLDRSAPEESSTRFTASALMKMLTEFVSVSPNSWIKDSGARSLEYELLSEYRVRLYSCITHPNLRTVDARLWGSTGRIGTDETAMNAERLLSRISSSYPDDVVTPALVSALFSSVNSVRSVAYSILSQQRARWIRPLAEIACGSDSIFVSDRFRDVVIRSIILWEVDASTKCHAMKLAIKSSCVAIRNVAFGAIARMESPASCDSPALRRMIRTELKSNSRLGRVKAARLSVKLHGWTNASEKVILDLIGSGHPFVRRRAVRSLRDLPEVPPRIRRSLVLLLDEGERPSRNGKGIRPNSVSMEAAGILESNPSPQVLKALRDHEVKTDKGKVIIAMLMYRSTRSEAMLTAVSAELKTVLFEDDDEVIKWYLNLAKSSPFLLSEFQRILIQAKTVEKDQWRELTRILIQAEGISETITRAINCEFGVGCARAILEAAGNYPAFGVRYRAPIEKSSVNSTYPVVRKAAQKALRRM